MGAASFVHAVTTTDQWLIAVHVLAVLLFLGSGGLYTRLLRTNHAAHNRPSLAIIVVPAPALIVAALIACILLHWSGSAVGEQSALTPMPAETALPLATTSAAAIDVSSASLREEAHSTVRTAEPYGTLPPVDHQLLAVSSERTPLPTPTPNVTSVLGDSADSYTLEMERELFQHQLSAV
jgi:hypothetical protein